MTPWPIDLDDLITPLPADAELAARIARKTDIILARERLEGRLRWGIYTSGCPDLNRIKVGALEATNSGSRYASDPNCRAIGAGLEMVHPSDVSWLITTAAHRIFTRDLARYELAVKAEAAI